MSSKIYLILENGDVFEGKSFGAPVKAGSPVVGELVFTTGMTGYLETLTDPSYYGQIVIQTFPLIGNYGVIPEDFESSGPVLKAYIVREWCKEPSNFRSEGELSTFLFEKGIPGLYDIDTRALTKIVREYGVMNAAISTEPEYDTEKLKAFRINDPVSHVSPKETKIFKSETSEHKVVLWDFGAKQNMVRSLNARGCDVICVPSHSTAEEIEALSPDGILLSNGPGDPKDNTGVINELKKLSGKNIPIFGICLGHQLLALANGADTSKLKYGHRGANQPVKFNGTGRVYITSQNHGYAVSPETLPAYAEVSFVNINDGTCEGVRYKDRPAFSVQFHPEACGGPRDTSFLFDWFMEMIEGGKN